MNNWFTIPSTEYCPSFPIWKQQISWFGEKCNSTQWCFQSLNLDTNCHETCIGTTRSSAMRDNTTRLPWNSPRMKLKDWPFTQTQRHWWHLPPVPSWTVHKSILRTNCLLPDLYPVSFSGASTLISTTLWGKHCSSRFIKSSKILIPNNANLRLWFNRLSTINWELTL